MSKDNCFFNKECKTNKLLFLMLALIALCVLSILVFAPEYAFAEDGKGDCAPAEEFVGPQSDDELLSIVTQNDSAYLPSNLEGWQESSRGTQYYKNGTPITGWLVDATYKNYGLQRYFFDEDAYLVKGRAITAEEADYWAYARPEGYVVRGIYDNGAARVFLADNDGRLPDNEGWLVTGQYSAGILQRYYIDSATHGAKSAFFDVDSQRYWGEGGCGYVFRGNGSRGGKLISANNDGKLLNNAWLCTADFGQGFQRYWFTDFSVPAQGAYNTGGETWTYVTSAGHVLRGTYDNGTARVYLANNDGVLASKEGWLVTGEYTCGVLQRYYIDGTAHAAKSSFFDCDGNRYWGEGGCGYVLRGCASRAGKLISANNDGKLFKEGWLCTDGFGQGFQRYWFIDYSVPSEGYYQTNIGSSPAVYTYVTGSGYVLRGTFDNGAGHVFLADNDGLLASNPGWLVSGTYTGGVLQRYFIDSTMPAAKTSFFTIDEKDYFGQGNVGYVVRGKLRLGNGVLLANNDGVLETTEGWLVTSAYDGRMERYRMDHSSWGHIAAHCGAFTIDEKLYYGRDNEGYVVRNDYVWIDGNLYHGDNDGVLTKVDVVLPLYHGIRHGIDVSKHQGSIDWGAVAASNTVGFAMIRAGYGFGNQDECFVNNYNNARANGIPVGAYWYSYATNPDEARREAQSFVSVLGGRVMDFPVAFDLEEHREIDAATNTAMINAFCEVVAAAGYMPMVYSSESWFNGKFNVYGLNANIYFWVAQWSRSPVIGRQEMMRIWQTSSSGSVPGISGRVDEDQVIY